jgi:hypothetical protein
MIVNNAGMWLIYAPQHNRLSTLINTVSGITIGHVTCHQHAVVNYIL